MAAPMQLSRSSTVIRSSTEKPSTNASFAGLPNQNYDNTESFTSGNDGLKDLGPANKSTPTRVRNEAQGTAINQKMDSPTGGQSAVIDPISRQILERTHSRAPGTYHGSPPSHGAPTLPEDPKLISRQTAGFTEAESLRRTDSLLSNKGGKEKKKGFLSRILGNKSKDEAIDPSDNVSEIMDNREPGTYAEVFSQPIGFVPKFPAPPRYIRVKAQNRRKRDLDRLFLAQILSEGAVRSRKSSDELDAKIHNINDRPVAPPPNSTRTKNNAIWAAEFSRDGQYYAAGGQDKKLKVWRVISSKEDRESAEDEHGEDVKLNAPVFKQELVREYEGHSSAILDLSWSKNNFLLSTSMDKTVRLYHISRPECLCAFKHTDFVTSVAFHPRDDRFFLAGSLDCKVRLWSIPDKSVAYCAQVQDMVTAVAFTPDGKTAIAGTLSGLCILYDTEGLKAHSQIHVRSNRGKNSKGSKITGIETMQIAREVGPPVVKLLITSNDSRVRLYNLRHRSLEAKFRGHENTTSQIRASFSDDGKFIICGSEDKRVYVWPTGPPERQDVDKRPVEIFEAHSAIVTSALMLPTKSRRLLARSGDEIFDLCNPPPVRLLSRADSVLSSQAPTESSDAGGRARRNSKSPQQPPEETPQYAARHSHNGGFILVTGDHTGEIKVFRQDCAYQKRREGSWDTASFSKKMLARSGSVATRASERSSTFRKSMAFGEPRSPANRENIIDWRNSVMSAKSTGAATSTSEVGLNDNYRSTLQQERDRSSSPSGMSGRRGFAHRFSLRHGSTPLANSTRPSTDESQRLQTPASTRGNPQRLSDTTINDNGPTSPDYYDASESARRGSSPLRPLQQGTSTSPTRKQWARKAMPNITLTGASPEVDGTKSPNGTFDNGLFLVDSQSYMAYDMKHSLMPMAQAQPRTPGPNVQPNGLRREESYVSSLSSEQPSTAPATPYEERGGSAGLGINGAGVSDGDKSEAEELKCKKCGSESFFRVKKSGTQRGSVLKCRRCGEVVSDS
ncbi:hypothetical protein OHC33_003449 [Knufia fluminis]|uniref:WD repeat-containing protein 44 n=1 Tax=Knufia fluminis TaxID=191047 RepID=A0AAN8EP88_9EURO|nr:hypothetical protein OHC33_003449 [Knufia fluminis]